MDGRAVDFDLDGLGGWMMIDFVNGAYRGTTMETRECGILFSRGQESLVVYGHMCRRLGEL